MKWMLTKCKVKRSRVSLKLVKILKRFLNKRSFKMKKLDKMRTLYSMISS